jgi:DNA repair exonuclease SbcCD ATPase subunit
MRRAPAVLTMMIALWAVVPIAGRASDASDTLDRAKEMLRRTQEALQQAKSDNAQLQREKSDTEQKLQQLQQASSRQLQAARSGSEATQKALQSQLQAAQASNVELMRQLNDAATRLVDESNKQSETAQQLAIREMQLSDARQALTQSRTANASCEVKNLKLYSYAEEMLQRYQKKGVWASLTQKEPVFGLKEVGVENVVQEYQQKYDSERIKP